MHRIHTKWRRYYLTIDMIKFTDVTASHVLVKSMYTEYDKIETENKKKRLYGN